MALASGIHQVRPPVGECRRVLGRVKGWVLAMLASLRVAAVLLRTFDPPCAPGDGDGRSAPRNGLSVSPRNGRSFRDRILRASRRASPCVEEVAASSAAIAARPTLVLKAGELQAGMAMAASNGLPVFSTPKQRTRSLRIAATTICLGLRRPWLLRRATRAATAGLKRIADSAGM